MSSISTVKAHQIREDTLAILKTNSITDYQTVRLIIEKYELIEAEKQKVRDNKANISPRLVNERLSSLEKEKEDMFILMSAKWGITYYGQLESGFKRKAIIDFWRDFFDLKAKGIERNVLTMRIPQSEIIRLLVKLDKINSHYNRIIQTEKHYKNKNNQLVKLKIILET